jgi:hypothetical protein
MNENDRKTIKTGRKFVFYRYNEMQDAFYSSDFYVVTGITKNGNLRVVNKYDFAKADCKRYRYIRPVYFESSTSPLWQETKNKPKYIIREVHGTTIEVYTKIIALVAYFSLNQN